MKTASKKTTPTDPASHRVAIVIVLHNSAAVIGECLKSIPHTIPVYVVDNASSDHGVEITQSIRPDAMIIRSDKNLGFGRGNNMALEKIETEYAFAINPDTVLEPDTIDNLLAVADQYQDAAIVAPIMYYANGEVQKTYKNCLFANDHSFDNYVSPEGNICTQWLLGAALLLRMDIFKKIGFFDPNIFLFYEDDDLCMNVRNHGFSIVLTPEAKMLHLSAKSSPHSYRYIYRKSWHMMWSRLYLEQKYKSKTASTLLARKYRNDNIRKTVKYLLCFRKKKLVMHIAELCASTAFLKGKGAFR